MPGHAGLDDGMGLFAPGRIETAWGYRVLARIVLTRFCRSGFVGLLVQYRGRPTTPAFRAHILAHDGNPYVWVFRNVELGAAIWTTGVVGACGTQTNRNSEYPKDTSQRNQDRGSQNEGQYPEASSASSSCFWRAIVFGWHVFRGRERRRT